MAAVGRTFGERLLIANDLELLEQIAGLLVAKGSKVDTALKTFDAKRVRKFASSMAESPPPTTAMGALLNHITGGANAETFQPMNVNFGLFPPLEGKIKKDQRKPMMSKRAVVRPTNYDWDGRH